jgi:hypothetical protein
MRQAKKAILSLPVPVRLFRGMSYATVGKGLLFNLLLFFAITGPIESSAINYTGNYNVGTAGTWTNLTSAFTAISAGSVTGNINLILVTGYPAAAETYPIAASANNGAFTVSIYPGVAGLSITSGSATGTINLNGSNNYIIDGRVNLAGAENLIIANTNTAGYAIQFINDASFNTIQYCNVQGVNTNLAAQATSGVILFKTALATGNNNNTIQFCDIHDGASTPTNCIYSGGTAGKDNQNDIVSNCNIYNFYVNATGLFGNGIDLEAGNTSWTISNNSFYQTSARVPTKNQVGLQALQINNAADGINFTVSGNYYGGSAANCGGAALSFDAGATMDSWMCPFWILSSPTSSCLIQNNTIANIAFGAFPKVVYPFQGINAAGGYVVITGNSIGNTTSNGSLTFSFSAASTIYFGIQAILIQCQRGSVDNNSIGSINIGGGSGKGGEFDGIVNFGNTITSNFSINNNTIGSTTQANSIQYTPSAAIPFSFTGISMAGTTSYNLAISNNTIQNISSLSSNTTNGGASSPDKPVGNTAMVAISDASTACVVTISSNTIANMSTTAPVANGLIGIYEANNTAGQTISNNIIHDLSNTYAGATADDIDGIYYNATGANTISANAIYNLTLRSTNTASSIYGINMAAGVATVSNNMITLGNGIVKQYAMYGIYQSAATNGNIYYFNSIYIGGAPTAAGSITCCFYQSVNYTITVKNNIFYNARLGGGTLNYSIGTANKASFTSNYNELFNATAANIGDIAGVAETYANWQAAAPAGDANSLNSNPSFVSPTTATPDLHIAAGSPVISKAVAGTGITIDFDNAVRSATPDIGAHEFHTNYYSLPAGTLDQVTTWGLNTDGTGAHPANFTTRNNTFNIRNDATPTLAAAWTVSGTGDLVILGDGITPCNFTIPGAFAFTGTINLSNVGTLTNQNTTNPTFGVINSNSTVDYNSANGVAQTVATATYGNLTISNMTGAGSSTKSLAATISIDGDLTVNAYATYDMLTFNSNRLSGGGILSLAANSVLRLAGTAGGAAPTAGSSSFPDNFSTLTLNTASTVEYNSAVAAQTIYNIPTYGNLTLTGAQTKTPGSNLTIAGNLLINATATFNDGGFTNSLAGNWTNSGTFTTTGTLTLNGSSAQTLSGATTFKNLTLDNTSGGFTLAANMSVSGTLTFKSTNLGLMNLNGNTLTIGTGAGVPGAIVYPATLSGWAYGGTLTRWMATTAGATALPATAAAVSTTGFFPLGSDAVQNAFEPFWFGQTSTISVGGTISLSQGSVLAGTNSITSYSDASWAGGTSVVGVSVANWVVSVPAGLTLSTANSARILFGGNGFQVFLLADINASNVANTVGTYVAPIQIYGVNDFEVARSGLTIAQVANTWYVGTKDMTASPLPIQLISFTASLESDVVNLNWTTSTETNNDYFTIEKSSDGLNYTLVGKQKGAGNSSEYLIYTMVDHNPFEGTSYYRLTQTDFNGARKTFNPIAINRKNTGNFEVFPNPSDGQNLFIKLSGDIANKEILVVVYDMQGKEIYSKITVTGQANDMLQAIDPNAKLAKGVYTIVATSDNMYYRQRVIIE